MDIATFVLTVGSHDSCFGFAGEVSPSVVVRTAVGVPSSECILDEGNTKPINLALAPFWPKVKYDHTNVAEMNWLTPERENFDTEIVSNLIQHFASKCHSLNGMSAMLAEPNENFEKFRSTTTEELFEKHSVSAICLQKKAPLQLFGCARTSGIVIDAGYSAIRMCAISTALVKPQTIVSSDIGGYQLLRSLRRILKKQPKSQSHFALPATAGPFVTDDYKAWAEMSSLEKILRGLKVMTDPAESRAIVNQWRTAGPAKQQQQNSFLLPDGNSLDIKSEAKLTEALFAPFLASQLPDPSTALANRKQLPTAIPEMIAECITQSLSLPADTHESIVVVGGLACLEGFAPRVRHEVEYKKSMQGDDLSLAMARMPLRMVSPPSESARQHAEWVGGSILPILSSFPTIAVSREQYNEKGPSAFARVVS